MKQKSISKIPSPEFEFFVSQSLSQYQGKYVALVGKRVISSGDSAKEVWEAARKKKPTSLPTIAKIPKKEILVLAWN